MLAFNVVNVYWSEKFINKGETSVKALSSLCVAGSLLLAGCGGSDSSDNGDNVLTGVFLDSAVSGLSYQTETLSGTTNSLGEFKYLNGENITFAIGSLTLPTIPAEETITPISLAPSKSIDDDTAINIARLLQSLDSDDNTSNGISISDVAGSVAAPVDFSVTQEEFTQNADVINLVANSGSVRTELLNSDVAVSHLADTLGIPSNRLVGAWRLTFEGGCFETLTFKSDNTLDIVDLGEIQTATYTLSTAAVGNNRNVLNIEVLSDNQEPGCDGETESSVGRVFTFFIEFNGDTVEYYSSVNDENPILRLTRQ